MVAWKTHQKSRRVLSPRCFINYPHRMWFNEVIAQVTWQASQRSEEQAHVSLPVHGAPVSVITTLYDVAIIFCLIKCGVAHFLGAVQVFDIRAPSSSLGYLCAKFRFLRGPYCWASPWRKIMCSITHSPSLFDAWGTEALALRRQTEGAVFCLTVYIQMQQNMNNVTSTLNDELENLQDISANTHVIYIEYLHHHLCHLPVWHSSLYCGVEPAVN